jgi:hypothetical protein
MSFSERSVFLIEHSHSSSHPTPRRGQTLGNAVIEGLFVTVDALKGNQGTLHADVSRFLDDPKAARRSARSASGARASSGKEPLFQKCRDRLALSFLRSVTPNTSSRRRGHAYNASTAAEPAAENRRRQPQRGVGTRPATQNGPEIHLRRLSLPSPKIPLRILGRYFAVTI